nr:hypothetical protein [Propionibacterium sp.]
MFANKHRLSTLDEALLEAVTDAVPPESATIERAWNREARGWFVEVAPRALDACPFTVGAHGRDTVRFTIGRGTSFEIHGVRKPRHLGLVKQLLGGIVGGRVQEYGGGRSGYATIGLTRGRFSTSRRGLYRFFPLPLTGRVYAPYATPTG